MSLALCVTGAAQCSAVQCSAVQCSAVQRLSDSAAKPAAMGHGKDWAASIKDSADSGVLGAGF
jgi:hypothetical protein